VLIRDEEAEVVEHACAPGTGFLAHPTNAVETETGSGLP